MTHETGWYSGIQGGTAGHRVVQQDTGWYRERSDIARHRLVQQDTQYGNQETGWYSRAYFDTSGHRVVQ